MKSSVFYTVISLLGLVAFAAVTAVLPAQVSVHYTGGVADRFASPWVFLAFPAAAAMISFALFAVVARMKTPRRVYVLLALFAAGGALSSLGWGFLAHAAQGAVYGERVTVMPWFIAALALTTLGMLAGYLFGAHGRMPALLSSRAPVLAAASLAGQTVCVALAFSVPPAYDWIGFLLSCVFLTAVLLPPPARLRK